MNFQSSILRLGDKHRISNNPQIQENEVSNAEGRIEHGIFLTAKEFHSSNLNLVVGNDSDVWHGDADPEEVSMSATTNHHSDQLLTTTARRRSTLMSGPSYKHSILHMEPIKTKAKESNIEKTRPCL